MQLSVPRVVPFVRRNVTVTLALATAPFVEVFLMDTVRAGRQVPHPDVSEVSLVALT